MKKTFHEFSGLRRKGVKGSIKYKVITCERFCGHQPASWRPVCWWPRCQCWCPWWWELPAAPSALPEHTGLLHQSFLYCTSSSSSRHVCVWCGVSCRGWYSRPEETMLTTMEEEVDELWTSRVTRTPMTKPARGFERTELSWKMSPAALPGWGEYRSMYTVRTLLFPFKTVSGERDWIKCKPGLY